MIVYIMGGFLGSGKTTLLMKLASSLHDQGKRVALVVNEMGEIGVDGATLKSQGYESVELPDGCICCTLSGSLQSALHEITKDIDPDAIIIEPTGLALPHKVKELVHVAMIDEEETKILGVADIKRFDDLIAKKPEFFKRQMYGADVIVINKSDLAEPEKMESAMNWLTAEYPDKKIYPVSAKTGHNIDIMLKELE